ncbi:MAG TPA: hypothetical protein VJV78_12750 [Polyangiales bacterium]|nr:hypothetical protein [Polyangiales bacterium]
MSRLASVLRAVVLAALLVNALDVTTSLIPSPADHLLRPAERSSWEWSLQLLGLLPLLYWLARRLPAAIASYRALPIPAPVRALLGVYFAIACVHVALRAENFPWSPVAMFSSAVPEAQGESFSYVGYVLTEGRWIKPISFLREGNQLFAEHDLGLDYKAGWAMRLYAPTHSSARDHLTQLLAARRIGKPLRVKLHYHRGTGRHLGLSRMVDER